MRIRFFHTTLLIGSLLLAGCIDDSASYQIGDRDHALSIFRVQPYFWQEEVALSLVVSHLPDCQRRHSVANVDASAATIELYETDAQKFMLHEGSRWYLIDSENCSLEPIDAPGQAVQGTLQGKFEEDEKRRLVFVAAQAVKQR